MIPKLQVLLIDDFPAFALTSLRNIPAFETAGLAGNQLDKEIPYVGVFEERVNQHEDSDKLDGDNVETKAERIDFSKYFELKWLRNAEDIQLYRKLCQHIEEEYSPARLGGPGGFVPEIVLFDYALTGHENKSYPKESEDFPILNESIPNYRLGKMIAAEKLEAVKNGIDPLHLSTTEIEKGLNNDNIGCVGGVLTVAYFRNYPCIGIATSRKNNDHLAGQEAKFVEALVKEEYQFDFSLRGNAKNLNWKVLLQRAAFNLRSRIEILIANGKIIPSLVQLMELAAGNISDRKFSFQSIYGEKHFPLDGLFIDISKDERDEAIKTYAKKCLATVLENASKNLTEEILISAMKLCDELLKEYDNCDLFLERVRFSQLKQKQNNKTISEEEEDELQKILDKYGMTREDAGYKNNCDLRKYQGSNRNLVRRYAALFVMVNIYRRYIVFRNNNADNEIYNGRPYVFAEPEKMDYVIAIYPRPETPLILPMHDGSGTLDRDLERNAKRTETDKKGLSVTAVLNNEAETGITPQERILLQSYALHIGLKKENFPTWIK